MSTSGAPPRPLLLHGFTGSAAAWPAPIVEGLTAAGRPPLRVDLPGHGRRAGTSDPRRFTLDATLADIDAALAVPGPADLVGYSMGGRVALHFAVRHPERVRRLVLESASPGLADAAEREERRASDEALATLLERDGIERFVDHWETLPLFASQSRLDPETLAGRRRIRLGNDARSLAAGLRGLGTGALPSLWSRLGEVAAPTLVIVGALDRKFVDLAERMAHAMEDADVVVVPDAGHAVHLERPDAWLEAVTEFLGAA